MFLTSSDASKSMHLVASIIVRMSEISVALFLFTICSQCFTHKLLRTLSLWASTSSPTDCLAVDRAMEYSTESARKSASQRLKTNDPHISMLQKFASAAGVKVGKLVEE